MEQHVFSGVIKSFNRKKGVFHCLFENDRRLYDASWEHIRELIVKDGDSIANACDDLHDALHASMLDACDDVLHANECDKALDAEDVHDYVQEEYVVSSSRKARERPCRSIKRGRPKLIFDTSQEDV